MQACTGCAHGSLCFPLCAAAEGSSWEGQGDVSTTQCELHIHVPEETGWKEGHVQAYMELLCATLRWGCLFSLDPGRKALNPLPLCSCQGDAQRGTVTCLRSQSKQVAKLGQTILLNHFLGGWGEGPFLQLLP